MSGVSDLSALSPTPFAAPRPVGRDSRAGLRLGNPALLLATGVVLLGLLTRAGHGASRDGLWRDEANAYFVVTESGSVTELFDNLRTESSPPLEPLIEYALYRAVGPDPAAMRTLVLLFGALSVLGVVLVGWRAFGPACGILAGLLAATSPYLIRISGDIRNSSIFGLLAVIHAAAYLRYLEGRSLRRACVWAASAAAMAYAHYYAFGIVACAGIGALATSRRRAEALRMAVAGTCFLLLYAPWLPSFLRQFGADLQPWYLPGTDAAGLYAVLRLPLGSAGAYLVAWGLLGSLLLLYNRTPASGAPREGPRLRFWGLIAVSAAPAALAWVMQVYVGAFDERYLIAMVLPLLPCTCLSWSRMFGGEPLTVRLPALREAITLRGSTRRRLAYLLLAAAFATQYLDPARWLRPSSPVREFASLIGRHGRPDDLIWIFPAPYASSFNYHFAGPQAQVAFPFRGRVTKVDWIGLREREQNPKVIAEFLDGLAAHLAKGRRVWAVIVERLPLDEAWSFSTGPGPVHASRLARAEMHVHRQALRLLYTRARVRGWWDRPHVDYHEGMVLALFAPEGAPRPR